MPTLLLKPSAGSKRFHVTPQSAGWTYVGFDLHHLAAGETATGGEPGREACLVFVTGRGHVTAEGVDLGGVGGRTSPFEGLPGAVYLPPGEVWTVTAETPCDLAVCTAPAEGGLPARVIAEEKFGRLVRGKGSNVRHVVNILPEDEPAESLLVVEVITPAGNSSSYPPHKHDRDALPDESLLEETYYHRINPPQGFAFQRVYTDDRSLDETMTVEDGDVTLVPKGYHPCVAPHGYDLYYLNVMAGPKRIWKFHNDPAHEWLIGH
jgi:5-deoxy-glucuronate isomerase